MAALFNKELRRTFNIGLQTSYLKYVPRLVVCRFPILYVKALQHMKGELLSSNNLDC